MCDRSANNIAHRLDYVSICPTFIYQCSIHHEILTDRDPANWKLDEKLIQRRRQVFWELFVIDKWKVASSFFGEDFLLIGK